MAEDAEVPPASGGAPQQRRRRQQAAILQLTLMSVSFLFGLVQIYQGLTATTLPHHDSVVAHHLHDFHVLATRKGRTSQNNNATITSAHQLRTVLEDADALPRPAVPATSSSTDLWKDKDDLRAVLAQAHANVTPALVGQLPTQTTLEHLYGPGVRIHGRDQCAAYRQRVLPEDRYAAVAGMFNTGTNLLANLLLHNVQLPGGALKNRWQVPWGKHRLASVRWNHTADGFDQDNKTNVLPIVMIRDPLFFFQSMCAHPYAARWRFSKQHCPNLVPTAADHEQFAHLHPAFQVSVRFDNEHETRYVSLAHLWSSWYNEYFVNYTDPYLMIRFEDLVYRPVEVLEQIADCLGATLADPLKFQTATSKLHGSGTDMLQAMIKTGNESLRYHNLTADDLAYATQHLDATLMEYFAYASPLSPQPTSPSIDGAGNKE